MKPVSNSAFYCCGIRMRDAESRQPICGDSYARQFMDARGLAIFQEFATQSAPNASNVARHRYIDDFLRARIGREPDLQVVLLGCGFDSRGRAESSAAAADARRPFRLHCQGLSAVGMTQCPCSTYRPAQTVASESIRRNCAVNRSATWLV
jgi:hypothetical protein